VTYHRLVCAVVLVFLIPVAVELTALAALAGLTVVVRVLVGMEAIRFAGSRERARRALAEEGSAH
jgi:histidine ammonia-lyase